MKYLLTITIGIILSCCLIAQTQQQIVLKFTIRSHGYGIPSDSIVIKNLTQDNEIRLYYPDTTLILNVSSGFEDITNNSGNFNLKSYPNPFENTTFITLNNPKNEIAKFSISDISGKIYFHKEIFLNSGTNNFKFETSTRGIYILNVITPEKNYSAKLISISNNSNSKFLNLEKINSNYQLKNNFEIFEDFPFNFGDNLQLTAYCSVGKLNYFSSPSNDYTYVFEFGEEIPVCENTPLIKDIDGKYYLTVQIGSQCWMQQNLKTTTFRNGDPIPNVQNSSIWKELTTAAFVWYENNIIWKNSYGALYNFYTIQDSRGICPAGWHVPSEQEWQTLLNFAGGQNSTTGNKLKSCRQIDSPIGDECATYEHPRWIKDVYGGNYGTDDYYFSALPGGTNNYEGNFFDLGASNYLWSSTEAWDPDYGIAIKIHYYDYEAEISYLDKKMVLV